MNRLMAVRRSSERTIVGRRTRAIIAATFADLERLRLDAGISLARVARAAGIDPGYLTRIIAGERLPSVTVLVALSRALGADLSIRAFSNTGPISGTARRRRSSRNSWASPTPRGVHR
jgi:transcriptional regulator with XRE-family HTH domain